MSGIINVTSLSQFNQVLASSKVVVVDCWAEWCGPCKTIAPIYEQLAMDLSQEGKITFTKVDVDRNQETARHLGVSAMPTFMLFESGQKVDTVVGADPRKLRELAQKIAQFVSLEGGAAASSSGGSRSKWAGASLPRGYSDVTDQVDVRGVEILNAEDDAGDVRVLLDGSKPSGLSAKGKGSESAAKKDHVESDTDEQLMLYLPFQSKLKVHTLQITSLPTPPAADGGDGDDEDDDDDERPMRPKTIKIYANRSTNMSFDEAESVTATQEITLAPGDWDAQTGTAKLELRFVKFQSVTSLVIFVVDGDGDGEKTRIDRVRIIGEAGEKRDQGRLERVGDDH